MKEKDKRIAEFLQKHQGGVSLYRIHKETGIAEGQVGKIFKGEHIPSTDKFFKICKVLKVDLKHITKLAKIISE